MLSLHRELILLVSLILSLTSAHPCPQDPASNNSTDIYDGIFVPPSQTANSGPPPLVEPENPSPNESIQEPPREPPQEPPIEPPIEQPQEPPKQELFEEFTEAPPCECVPYYLCDNNGTIIEDGTGIIDIRVKPEQCEDAIQVCCTKKGIRDKDNAIKPDRKAFEGCGYRNDGGVGMRITGGNDGEAQFGEFPWMVAILEESAENFIYKCGGSLIHPRVVLTAAHCVDKRKEEKQLFARAGEWDTQTKNEIYQFEQERVERVIIHEKYYHGGLHNDVALLFLEKPLTVVDHIGLACLPEQGDVILDKDCFASGWGKDKFEREGQYQVILKKVELPMVPRDECQKLLRTTRVGKHFKLHESFVCAGGIPGKDTCKGDGGSPLVCPIPGKPGRYHQAGIVAWGISCGSNIPGVYVNVAHFRDWVDNHMLQANFPIEYTPKSK